MTFSPISWLLLAVGATSLLAFCGQFALIYRYKTLNLFKSLVTSIISIPLPSATRLFFCLPILEPWQASKSRVFPAGSWGGLFIRSSRLTRWHMKGYASPSFRMTDTSNPAPSSSVPLRPTFRSKPSDFPSTNRFPPRTRATLSKHPARKSPAHNGSTCRLWKWLA